MYGGVWFLEFLLFWLILGSKIHINSFRNRKDQNTCGFNKSFVIVFKIFGNLPESRLSVSANVMRHKRAPKKVKISDPISWFKFRSETALNSVRSRSSRLALGWTLSGLEVGSAPVAMVDCLTTTGVGSVCNYCSLFVHAFGRVCFLIAQLK